VYCYSPKLLSSENVLSPAGDKGCITSKTR